MGLLAEMMELVTGKVHLYISVGDMPAIEILIKDKEITADIKNPLLALEFGLEQLFKKRAPRDSFILKKVKESGYRIKIKYKMLELEL